MHIIDQLDQVQDLNPNKKLIMEYTPLNYFGIDYLAAICAIIGMFYIGDKKRIGFVLYMMATSLGLVFAFLAKPTPDRH